MFIELSKLSFARWQGYDPYHGMHTYDLVCFYIVSLLK